MGRICSSRAKREPTQSELQALEPQHMGIDKWELSTPGNSRDPSPSHQLWGRSNPPTPRAAKRTRNGDMLIPKGQRPQHRKTRYKRAPLVYLYTSLTWEPRISSKEPTTRVSTSTTPAPCWQKWGPFRRQTGGTNPPRTRRDNARSIGGLVNKTRYVGLTLLCKYRYTRAQSRDDDQMFARYEPQIPKPTIHNRWAMNKYIQPSDRMRLTRHTGWIRYQTQHTQWLIMLAGIHNKCNHA